MSREKLRAELSTTQQPIRDMQLRAVQARVLRLIVDERDKQDIKWGKQRHAFCEWQTILSEEVGEFAQEVLGMRFGPRNNYGANVEKAIKELSQVAAVSVAIIEHLLEELEDEGCVSTLLSTVKSTSNILIGDSGITVPFTESPTSSTLDGTNVIIPNLTSTDDSTQS